jgi:hypothetical protein
MTQEDKNLLIQDLCGRLPYGVKCEVISYRPDGEILYIKQGKQALKVTLKNVFEGLINARCDWAPYLFPLSSMTEEQKKEEYEICKGYIIGYEPKLIDFYNKNHIDYRGLIPLGLAVDCTNLNIY